MISLLGWFRRPLGKPHKVVDIDLTDVPPLKDGDTLELSYPYPEDSETLTEHQQPKVSTEHSIPKVKIPHQWVPSTLGHGELMCTVCFCTDHEAAVLGIQDNCFGP